MSGRAFEFSIIVQRQVFARQENRCALCGEDVKKMGLTEQQKERGQVKGLTTIHFHHVLPNQTGDPHNNTHQWLKTSLNCVMLCPVCHENSHENADYQKL